MTDKRRIRRMMRTKLLDRIRNNPANVRFFNLSRRKTLIRVGKFKVVLRDSDLLLIEIQRLYAMYLKAAQVAQEVALKKAEAAERRAANLLQQIVREHDCLTMMGQELIIRSKNGKLYTIDIRSGQVHRLNRGKRRFICVFVPRTHPDGGCLPVSDTIIAKAITIAYAPYRISTL